MYSGTVLDDIGGSVGLTLHPGQWVCSWGGSGVCTIRVNEGMACAECPGLPVARRMAGGGFQWTRQMGGERIRGGRGMPRMGSGTANLNCTNELGKLMWDG